MKSKLKIEQVFEIIDKLKELYPENVNFVRGDYGSGEDILKAEKELSVKFPEDFKKFVLKYESWLNVWAGEIFGSQTLSYTLQNRELGEGDPGYFPEYLIYVCDYGGVYVCIDTSKNNQIVYWGHETTWQDENDKWYFESEVEYESFTEFLFYYVVQEVEYSVSFDESEETIALEKEIEYLKTLSSHYNKDKPYLTLV